MTREPDGTGDTVELLRAGLSLQQAPSETMLHDDATRHDTTPGTPGEDAAAILSLERLVATREREWEAAQTREAPRLQRETALLALLRAPQDTPHRVLEQGCPPPGFVARLVASWRSPPSSGPTPP